MKARMLLKAEAGETGEAWSDSQIANALETGLATIARTRQQFVEEGFDAVLTRKHSPNSARTRIFDGAAEAKLIALACSEQSKGRARWTLRLLEDKVVDQIVAEDASAAPT
jgi:poly-gamma-glutamate capsule biosynthesis protein CapA/YwtB (metallophosphatase superfamily)